MQQIEYIPLGELVIAPENVRKTRPSTIKDLAASIKAQGLKQNLVGYRQGGRVMVSAGGRRLTAMQELELAGELPEILASEGVPVLVSDAASALEASLAENTVREAMHPADEFMAFEQLKEREKLSIGEIAARYGVEERHVEQRMRLARVAPAIIEEYRQGGANLDQIKALAIVDDHKLQEKVWKAGANNPFHRQPNQIRNELLSQEISITSPLGRFVGVEAYEAAGGTPRRDLFSETVSLPDPKLTNRIAMKALQAEAAKAKAEGWGWVEARLSFPYHERCKYQQSSSGKPDPKRGVIVSIDENTGELAIHRGLLKPGEKISAQKSAPAKKGGSSAAAETKRRLDGIRIGIVRRHLRENPDIALASLTAAIAADVFNMTGKARDAAHQLFPVSAPFLSGTDLMTGIKTVDPGDAPEFAKWERVVKAGVKKRGSVLAWLMEEDANTTLDLLAFLTTQLFTDEDVFGEDETELHAYCKTAGLVLAEGWEVDRAWLAKQPRAWVLEALKEAAGEAAAKATDKINAPKDFIAAAFNLLVDNSWVPKQLRGPKPKKPAKKAAKKGEKKAAKTTPKRKPAVKALPAPMV